jgi:hypothetical protein
MRGFRRIREERLRATRDAWASRALAPDQPAREGLGDFREDTEKFSAKKFMKAMLCFFALSS